MTIIYGLSAKAALLSIEKSVAKTVAATVAVATIAVTLIALRPVAFLKYNESFVFPEFRAPVSGAMNDPSSVQFKNEILVMNGNALCGEVNAKNGYGAYVGFKRFISSKTDGVEIDGVGFIGEKSTSRISEELEEGNRLLRGRIEQLKLLKDSKIPRNQWPASLTEEELRAAALAIVFNRRWGSCQLI